MQEIFEQLGNLLLNAVPTILLFIVLVVAYQILVQGPLTRTLKERQARTVGAVEDAHRAIAEAERKAAEYAERLRQARAEAYKAREQRARDLNAEREAALETARKASAVKVSEAKAELDAEAAHARQAIEVSAGDLAHQVVGAVLPLAAGGSR